MSLNLFALVPSVAFAGVMPIIARYSLGINFYRNIFVLFFTYMFTILSVAVFMIKTYPVADAAFEIVMTLYISYGFSSLVLLRDMPYGEYIYLIAFLIPWMSDAGAYFIGCNFGNTSSPRSQPKRPSKAPRRHRIRHVSVYIRLYHRAAVRPSAAVRLAGLCGILIRCSQCGDLVASLIKRHYNVKDYGKYSGPRGVLAGSTAS